MAWWFIRPHWRMLAAAGLAGGLLTACAQPLVVGPADSRAAPRFEVTMDRAGDRAVVTSGEVVAIFDIWSETGIGGAHASLTAGDMPPALLLRLHLRGLEQMTFAFDDTVVSLSVPSGDDRLILRRVAVHGDEAPVTPQSPYWMEVTRVEAGSDAAGGYFQVTAPQAFIDASATQFTISWIDFYR